mmetsp:Transcript_18180/g.23933  ORF Transcript_18180/g.23933 Transcript_18180/m.23933 type:complete len:415 (-) Transcript_18180:129-1373(-)
MPNLKPFEKALLATGAAAATSVLVYKCKTWLKRKNRRNEASSLDYGIESMLLGVAIGDAFGAGIEFQDAHFIRRTIGFDRWINLRGRYFTWDRHSSQNFICGMYTDDCEMTVGLMKALLSPKGVNIDADDMIEWWRKEYENSKKHFLSTRLWALFGVGRNGHGSIGGVYRGEKNITDVRNFQVSRTYPGNAGPMRCLPISFIKDEKARLKLSLANSNSTHPHQKSRAATVLMAEAGRYLMVDKADPKGVIQFCIEMLSTFEQSMELSSAYDEETLKYLKTVDSLSDYHSYGDKMERLPLSVLCGPQPIAWATKMQKSEIHGLDASAMHTLGVVLYLIKWHQGGALDLLKYSMWIGGDVDSVGALTLGLLGGTAGLSFGEKDGLPLWMVEDLEDVEGLLSTSREFSSWVGCKIVV